MSLLHPTPGQIADRHAALLVKRDHFIGAGKNADHLIDELLELQDLLPGRQQFNSERTELYSLHLAMWNLIDLVGDPERSDAEVAAASRSLHAMNLDRHRTIARIDAVLGEYKGDEKLNGLE